jgi:hypothetical protein
MSSWWRRGGDVRAVGWLALGVGAALTLGADVVARLVGPPNGERDTFGLRLAGVRDLALGAALLGPEGRRPGTRRVLERAVMAIQAGDVITAIWLRSRGRLSTTTVVGVVAGALVTAAALAVSGDSRVRMEPGRQAEAQGAPTTS